MTRRSWIAVSVLLLGTVWYARVCSGQASTAGGLSGTVADSTGAVVPGASLTISQPSTGFNRSVTGNADGSYAFPNLDPGQYSLKVSAKGFADAVYDDVTVVTGRALNLNVQMKIGPSTQTVEVSGAGEVLETTTNTLATTISPDSVQDLPLNGRDALPFAQLVSGAQSGGDQRFETFNAMPNASLNITVDGMNDNFQRYRTSTTGFYDAAPLRIGAIDEVTVSTTDLTADAGAEGAVTLRFELKKGTNRFHGNAFWQTQNSAFDANTYVNNAQDIPKAKFHLSDFGGSLGGPIWKNRVFFFGNYEQSMCRAACRAMRPS
jgi:Carboxypeptidase regulatory-like domain